MSKIELVTVPNKKADRLRFLDKEGLSGVFQDEKYQNC